MIRLIFILGGIVTALFGVSVIISPAFYDSRLGFYFDFTSIRWPFGIFIVAVGVLTSFVALRRKASDFVEEFFICPRCEKSYRKKDLQGVRCPVCKVGLEKLKGYYDHGEK